MNAVYAEQNSDLGLFASIPLLCFQSPLFSLPHVLPSSRSLCHSRFMLRYSCVAANSNEHALYLVKQIAGQEAHPLCTEPKLICTQCCHCETL